MAQTITHVLNGNVLVYLKDYAADNDPVDETDNTLDISSWTLQGYQGADGLVAEFSTEWEEIFVLEHGMAIKRDLIGQSFTVALPISEEDIEAMEDYFPGSTYAAGAAPGTNPDTLKLGSKSIHITEQSLCFVGMGADVSSSGACVFFPKMHMTGVNPIPYKKGLARVNALTFSALADTSRDAGEEIGIFYRITVGA